MGDYMTTKVEWSPAGASNWTSLGRIKSQGSSNDQDVAAEEASDGTELYAGTDDPVVVFVVGLSLKAALRAKMLADELVDLRFTDHDAATVTNTGYSVMVKEGQNFQPKTRNGFEARFKRVFI